MSFYVTLPSNSSSKFYPKNTLTKFTTKLHSTIELDGLYEVALTEIIFPFNWRNSLHGLINYGCKSQKLRYSFDVDGKHFATVVELLDTINKEIQSKSLPILFQFKNDTNRVMINIPFDHYVEFKNDLNRDLGFIYKYLEGNKSVTQFISGHNVAPNINVVNALYVYTDVVEYQYVGDTFAPLLRVVAVENNITFGQYVDKIYSSPHYVPVTRNSIDNIEIEIMSDFGEPIQFLSGKILVKLHFRPKSFF